jgi:23S rRNA (uracil1939-C5)-methyltransferase
MKPRRRPAARSTRPPAPPPAAPAQLLAIEKPIYGGAFLARSEGKAVFVPLALPGEQARVHIVEDKRSFATAELDAILASAPERRPAPCPHFGPCGGCHYQHAADEAQLRFKQAILRETLERAGVPPPDAIEVLAGNPWTYRNRIRLAFDRAGNPGYRGRRSHHILPIAACPIAAPRLVNAALEIAGLFRALPPAHRPNEIALFCNADETALLASAFTAGGAAASLKKQCEELLNRIPSLRGMELVEQHPGHPPRTLAQCGEAALTYRAAGFGYRVDHGAFFQVNRWLVEPLVERVTAGRSGALAWDLFAGVGLFARQLAARYQRVVAVESAPAAAAALAHNLRGAPAEPVDSSTLAFLQRARRRPRPDLIVLDPPRTGLGAEATALLAEIAAPSLTCVSCDPATLARDLRVLLAAGYAIERLTLADLFPQTFHIETIVDLRRTV